MTDPTARGEGFTVAWVHCLFVATFQSLNHIAENLLGRLFSVWLESDRYAANYPLIPIFPFRHCSPPDRQMNRH